MRSTFLAFALLLLFTLNTSASVLLDPPAEVRVISKDFQLFKDKDFRIMYVDFELLTTNVKSLQIIGEKGDVKFSDDVSKMDVDAIYELDYTDYKAGKYTIELNTYTGKTLNSEFVIE